MAKQRDIPEVIIAPEQEPIPVVVEPQSFSGFGTVTKGKGITLSPTTTEADDLVTAGQRHINLIWENTQSRIAIVVVVVGIIINSLVILMILFLDQEVSVTQLALISICLQFINLTVGIVIGFYFSRTNHSAQGGVGTKAVEYPYTGR